MNIIVNAEELGVEIIDLISYITHTTQKCNLIILGEDTINDNQFLNYLKNMINISTFPIINNIIISETEITDIKMRVEIKSKCKVITDYVKLKEILFQSNF